MSSNASALRSIKVNEPSIFSELCVNALDKKYNGWERLVSLEFSEPYLRFGSFGFFSFTKAV